MTRRIIEMTDPKVIREFAAGYETAILDVWYVLHHLKGTHCLSEETRNQLLAAENRLRGVLEATGRFEQAKE